MNFITTTVYLISSLILGAIFMGLSANLLNLTDIQKYLEKSILTDFSSSFMLGLAGLIIILLCLRHLQMMIRRVRRDEAIIFETANGKVSITLLAIEEMLKRMLEERRELSRIKPRIILKKKGIEVVIRSDLNAEINVVNFTRDIQEKIKEKMVGLLGDGQQIHVRVEIKKMSFRDKNKNKNRDIDGRQDEKEEIDEPEVPFRNY